MIRKIIICGMFLFLVAAVAIGLTTTLKTTGGDHQTGQLSSEKMIASICDTTKYKQVCVDSLAPVAGNSSATAQDYILAVVGATSDEVRKAIDFVDRIRLADHPNNHVAARNCKFFLQYAWGRLQESISQVAAAAGHEGIKGSGHDLLSRMSGVFALQEYCRDPIEDPSFKLAVGNGTLAAYRLTHNAVNIMATLSRVLKLLNVGSWDEKASGVVSSRRRRRLMSSPVYDWYPSWLKASDRRLLAGHGGRPHVVVAKDGSGQFRTIGEAVAAYPANHQGRFVIYVKAGMYEEAVKVDEHKPNVFIYGDGIDKTIVTGKMNTGKMGLDMMDTATFANEAYGFLARGMTFRNEAGPEGLQAVAFRSMGEQSALFDCSFEGYQDTLFYQSFRQFYRNCRIYGTVDFIFEKGDAVIQDSDVIVRRPLPGQYNVVAADGRGHEESSTGVVIQNCRIIPDADLSPVKLQIQTYLGRPWGVEARMVVMQSELQDLLEAEGWRVWDGEERHKDCEAYEYENRGPGSKTGSRSKAFPRFKVLSHGEAARFGPGPFLEGWKWLPGTGFPFYLGL